MFKLLLILVCKRISSQRAHRTPLSISFPSSTMNIHISDEYS